MKQYNRIIAGCICMAVIIMILMNVIFTAVDKENSTDLYKVELNRLYHRIETAGYDEAVRIHYQHLVSVERLPQDASEEEMLHFYEPIKESYEYGAVRDANGKLIVIKVCYVKSEQNRRGRLLMNAGMSCVLLIVLAFLWYLKHQIIKPFHTIEQLPYELAKGNLVPGLKESRYHYFGRFLWGLDLLRQKLEENQRERMELEREKKLLILSISHDINTPVSSIQMSAKALYEDLYTDAGKKKELAWMIGQNAKKIGEYVNQIKQVSKEDFLKFTVEPSEFYLKDLMDQLFWLYQERCEQSLTDLTIGTYANQLILGDFDRCLEVLQNVMENALKYGDGHYIRITFDREEDCRLIHIRNSGDSLEEKELVHLFESFYRGSNASNLPGSGLGLYIGKQLMQRMDGDIYANLYPGEFEVTVVVRIA